MTDFFNKSFDDILNGFANMNPGTVFYVFLAVVIAAFVFALIFSGKAVKGYISAFAKAVAYLNDKSTEKLGKNNLNYFFKNYAVGFPIAMQIQIKAYFESRAGKPSRFVTEAVCLKLESVNIRKRTGLAVFDLILAIGFLSAISIAAASGGTAVLGAAFIPLAFGIAFRFALRQRNVSLSVRLKDGFYDFVDALDNAVIVFDDMESKSELSTLKRASALIRELIEEEKETQRYRFVNKADELNRELRFERLKEIADNVAIVCGENTSAATLKQIFGMIAGSKHFYGSVEESEIINGCLLKLKNAIVKAEREIIDIE
ncbi:MAG: hypothetical protein LBQ27_04300 [Clostridiales bacterium]|jgi:hypothetical protein|nr:hypothetical protein [Clostridiales bacterium]